MTFDDFTILLDHDLDAFSGPLEEDDEPQDDGEDA